MKRVVLCSTPEVQVISLMECMESWGAPTSRTGTPSRADRMGPMVVPHGLSLRTITSWGVSVSLALAPGLALPALTGYR